MNAMLKKAARIYDILGKEYAGATTALEHEDPFQLMVATILSAQCTDKRVNLVTKALFRKYKTPGAYAGLSQQELEKYVRSTGFYRNKAKNIIAASGKILKEFGGKVPDSMEKLVTLPGVARKTANIVLFHGFGRNDGIAVDTHVKRLSFRIGLTRELDPVKVEKDLMEIFPKEKWGSLSNILIEHGRKICNARKPLCEKCECRKLCDLYAATK